MRELRTSQNISIKDICYLLNISKQRYNDIESGRRLRFSNDRLILLADLLHIDKNVLFLYAGLLPENFHNEVILNLQTEEIIAVLKTFTMIANIQRS